MRPPVIVLTWVLYVLTSAVSNDGTYKLEALWYHSALEALCDYALYKSTFTLPQNFRQAADPAKILPFLYNCRYSAVVKKIPFKHSWIRIVIGFSIEIECFAACETPHPSKYTVFRKKHPLWFLSITSASVDRFSKFFHLDSAVIPKCIDH